MDGTLISYLKNIYKFEKEKVILIFLNFFKEEFKKLLWVVPLKFMK